MNLMFREIKHTFILKPRFPCLSSRLLQLLQDYGSALSQIPALLRPLMEPLVGRVEAALSPGLTTLSWTAIDTDACKLTAEGRRCAVKWIPL